MDNVQKKYAFFLMSSLTLTILYLVFVLSLEKTLPDGMMSRNGRQSCSLFDLPARAVIQDDTVFFGNMDHLELP